MRILFDPFTAIGFPNLFTLMWVGAFVIVIGAVFVYVAAQRRYRQAQGRVCLKRRLVHIAARRQCSALENHGKQQKRRKTQGGKQAVFHGLEAPPSFPASGYVPLAASLEACAGVSKGCYLATTLNTAPAL